MFNANRCPSLNAWLITLCALSTYGVSAAGLNVVPSLPPLKAEKSGNADAEDFWAEFWNGPGGFKWRDVSLTGAINYKGFYTDNLLSTSAVKQGDFVNYITPLIRIDRLIESDRSGTSFQLAYQPTFILNAQHPEYDRNYQAVQGGIEHQWRENTLSVSHQYQKTSEGLSQSGLLAPQQANSTTAGFQRPLTGKIHLELEAQQTLSKTDQLPGFSNHSLDTWDGSLFATTDLFPKINSGVGLGGGYSEQRGNGSLYRVFTERLLSRWTYLLTGKLTMRLEAGVQIGQSQEGGVSDPDPAPIFRFNVDYAPRYGTSFSIGASRTSGSAQFFRGENIIQTGAQFSARQRLFEEFALLAGVGYFRGDYQVLDSHIPNIAADYEGYSVSTEIQWRLNARISSGLFYQFQSRTSARVVDTLDAHQVGLNLNLRF